MQNNLTQNNLAQNNLTENNLTQNNLAQNNITENNLTQNNITQNNITKNNHLTINSNNSILTNGINIMPFYANNGNVNIPFNLIHKYFSNIKTIRLEINPNYMNVTKIKNLIYNLFNNNFNVIVTYHDYLGSDNLNDLLNVANWWKNNYNYISSNFPLIINICNEYGSHNLDYIHYSEFYNKAINIIRTIYTDWLIIDIPGYGQNTNVALQASNFINDKKIVFSTHIYPMSWNNNQSRFMNTDDIDNLLNTNRPIIIGEFGTGEGNTDVNKILLYAKSKRISLLLWGAGDGTSEPYNMELFKPSWYINPLHDNYNYTTYFITYYSKYLI